MPSLSQPTIFSDESFFRCVSVVISRRSPARLLLPGGSETERKRNPDHWRGEIRRSGTLEAELVSVRPELEALPGRHPKRAGATPQRS
jgi:hypothetical protein